MIKITYGLRILLAHKPWEFLVYSEGKQFLNFKKEWRSHSYDMYTDLQHSITQIGRTIFEFKNDTSN